MKYDWPRRLLLLTLCLTATACVHQRATYLPDGRKAYAISCKGVLHSWQSCLIRAGRLCASRGYDTIRSEEGDRELLFACKTH